MGRYYEIYAYNNIDDKEEDKFTYSNKLWFGLVDTGVAGLFGSETIDYYYITGRGDYVNEYEFDELTDAELESVAVVPGYCETNYYVDREKFDKCDLTSDLSMYETNFNFYCLFEAINNLKENGVKIRMSLDDLKEKLKSKSLTFEEAEDIEMKMYDVATEYDKELSSTDDMKYLHIKDSAITLGYGCLFASLLFKYEHISVEENYC